LATTGIWPSSSVVAVVEETRLLPAFGSSYIGAVVYATWLLPAFGSLMIVAVVEETWLLPAFESLHCESKNRHQILAHNFAKY